MFGGILANKGSGDKCGRKRRTNELWELRLSRVNSEEKLAEILKLVHELQFRELSTGA